MFDESIWNQPFQFNGGPINVTVQPDTDEFFDLLDDNTFLEDAVGTYEDIKLTSEYHVKTTMKMSKIVEGARLQQAAQVVSMVITPQASDITKIGAKGESPPLQVLKKRDRGAEGTQKPVKTPKIVQKPKPSASTAAVASLPPVNNLVPLSTRYVDMYVNVMNSGSFTTIQKFLYKYMSRPCKMVVEHDVRASFRLPKLAFAEGPALMAHFFLGCLVMYPDMLVELKGSSTVVSNDGRKIVMRVVTHATKSVHLPFEEWIPVMSNLQNTYERLLQAPLTHTERQANQVEAELQAQIEDSKHIQNFSLEVPPVVSSLHSCVSSSRDTVEQEQCISSNSSVTTVSTLSSTNTTFNTITNATARNSAVSYFEDIPLIPESYVKSLYSKAKLLPTPTLLVMKGTITMHLDSSDHVYDIVSDFVQVNTA